jgi:phospholipid/cholesterol/gamma-HCH transport system ATP-binding protein
MTAAGSGTERRRICSKMGVLFQAAALFDSLTLFDNVAFPLRQRRELEEEAIRRKTSERLDQVGLVKVALRFPGELPMGMRKRTGIARALVTDPETILFDEPNTGLDPEVGQEIYELIRRTQAESGFTGIVISHEIPEVFQVCDRVAMLYQGKIQEEGSVESFSHSTNPVVVQFVRGDTNGPIQLS